MSEGTYNTREEYNEEYNGFLTNLGKNIGKYAKKTIFGLALLTLPTLGIAAGKHHPIKYISDKSYELICHNKSSEDGVIDSGAISASGKNTPPKNETNSRGFYSEMPDYPTTKDGKYIIRTGNNDKEEKGISSVTCGKNTFKVELNKKILESQFSGLEIALYDMDSGVIEGTRQAIDGKGAYFTFTGAATDFNQDGKAQHTLTSNYKEGRRIVVTGKQDNLNYILASVEMPYCQPSGEQEKTTTPTNVSKVEEKVPPMYPPANQPPLPGKPVQSEQPKPVQPVPVEETKQYPGTPCTDCSESVKQEQSKCQEQISNIMLEKDIPTTCDQYVKNLEPNILNQKMEEGKLLEVEIEKNPLYKPGINGVAIITDENNHFTKYPVLPLKIKEVQTDRIVFQSDEIIPNVPKGYQMRILLDYINDESIDTNHTLGKIVQNPELDNKNPDVTNVSFEDVYNLGMSKKNGPKLNLELITEKDSSDYRKVYVESKKCYLLYLTNDKTLKSVEMEYNGKTKKFRVNKKGQVTIRMPTAKKETKKLIIKANVLNPSDPGITREDIDYLAVYVQPKGEYIQDSEKTNVVINNKENPTNQNEVNQTPQQTQTTTQPQSTQSSNTTTQPQPTQGSNTQSQTPQNSGTQNLDTQNNTQGSSNSNSNNYAPGNESDKGANINFSFSATGIYNIKSAEVDGAEYTGNFVGANIVDVIKVNDSTAWGLDVDYLEGALENKDEDIEISENLYGAGLFFQGKYDNLLEGTKLFGEYKYLQNDAEIKIDGVDEDLKQKTFSNKYALHIDTQLAKIDGVGTAGIYGDVIFNDSKVEQSEWEKHFYEPVYAAGFSSYFDNGINTSMGYIQREKYLFDFDEYLTSNSISGSVGWTSKGNKQALDVYWEFPMPNDVENSGVYMTYSISLVPNWYLDFLAAYEIEDIDYKNFEQEIENTFLGVGITYGDSKSGAKPNMFRWELLPQ